MSKQTAVDFLREKLDKYIMWNEGDHKAEEYTLSNLSDDFEQAKRIEKEQIIKSRENGISEGYRRTNNYYYDKMVDSEQYYTETFKQ